MDSQTGRVRRLLIEFRVANLTGRKMLGERADLVLATVLVCCLFLFPAAIITSLAGIAGMPQRYNPFVSIPLWVVLASWFAVMVYRTPIPPERLYEIENRLPIKLQRIRGAVTDLGRMTEQLTQELTVELEQRTVALEKLIADAEMYEKLAKANKPQAEALAKLLGVQLKENNRHLDRVAWVVGVIGWGLAVLPMVVGK